MNDSNATSGQTSRRDFLKTSSTLALGGAVAAPYLSLSSSAFGASTQTLKIGLIGCGGRGRGAASQALNADPNTVLTAIGDVFQDQIDHGLVAIKHAQRQHPHKVQVDRAHQFIGLDAYQKVIDSGVDVVILTTPPGFRPQQLKASVAANKHIFCEKPVATDAPGLRSVLETVKLSKTKDIALVAGLCWRYDYARRAFYGMVHSGAIGDVRAIYATYYTGVVKPMPPASARPAGWTDLEWEIRNWYNFCWLCGDSLVEQAVHSVDKIAWAMHDHPPLKAVAVGGRQIPSPGGNIYDHFEVNYEYPNGVRGFMGSRQINGCYNQNADYVIGSKGEGTIGVRPFVEIHGERDWRYRGETPNMYQVEHNEMFASIRSGRYINNGDRMSSSTMMALMGRMAAYTGREITWDQAMNSQERLVPEHLTWDMKLTVRPRPMPGITRFM